MKKLQPITKWADMMDKVGARAKNGWTECRKALLTRTIRPSLSTGFLALAQLGGLFLTIAYFDCFSGAAGDMIVGSLLDAGASLSRLQDYIYKMGLDVSLQAEKQVVKGITGTRFVVRPNQVQPLRYLDNILHLIDSSPLPAQVKAQSRNVFVRLARAEAAVHHISPDKVHFHEIGAVDTIVDIVGTFLCLEQLEVSSVAASPLPWNSGFIKINHGLYPLPAPATANLLKGIPVVGCSEKSELVTPTGAAILSSICDSFGEIPSCQPLSLGYGAGTLERSDGVPNLLRVIIGRKQVSSAVLKHESVGVLQTQIDDMNPEIFSHLATLLNDSQDVLDTYTSPIMMKKNRPGIIITVLTRPEAVEHVAFMLLQETTTLGIRYHIENRYVVDRSSSHIDTPWGQVKIKIAKLASNTVRIKPEFADCQAIAQNNHIPLLDVYTVINGIIAKMSDAEID